LTKISNNVRLSNKKGRTPSNEPYAFRQEKYFYERDYTSNLKPNLYKEKSGYEFYNARTVKFTSLAYLYDLWYPLPNIRKIVPIELKEYLTPLALAIWFMDDGSFQNGGEKFTTQSFTYQECLFLAELLKEKYSLKVTVNKFIENQFYSYIWKQSIPKFRELVSPYLIYSMN
jgi:hypothetical protein